MTCPICTIKPDPECPLCKKSVTEVTECTSPEIVAIQKAQSNGAQVQSITVVLSDGTSVTINPHDTTSKLSSVLSLVAPNTDGNSSSNVILGGMSTKGIHITATNLIGVLSQQSGVPLELVALKMFAELTGRGDNDEDDN